MRKSLNLFILFFLFVFSSNNVFSFERNYDTKHIKLKLSFDLEEKSLSGEAQLTFTPLVDNLTTMKLHAKDMEIRSVLLGENTPISFSSDSEIIQITLPRAYSTSEKFSLTISYHTKPNLGVFFNQPTDEYPNRPVQIYSHSEPIDARCWFPCYDAPDDKVTSELIASVPAKFFLLSNGRLMSVKSNQMDQTKTYHWIQDKPHSTYLISLAAGEYVEIEENHNNLPLYYYVYPKHKVIAKNSFGNTPKMIDIFERLFGYAYPWNKYAQIIVHDYQAAGMEHTGATTLYNRTIHDDRAHLDWNSDDLVAHELAHQWFGNLVTCHDWSHLWLNEGFATYSEILFTEQFYGRDEAEYAVYRDQNFYLQMRDSKFAQPVYYESFRHPEDMFNVIEYQKAGQVLHMLRYVVGDSVYFNSLKTYLNRFAFETATTQDFIAIVEEMYGKKLDWFFDQWIFKGGHPRFTVKSQWDAQKKQLQLVVEQTQQDSLGLVPLVFQMPVEIEFGDSAEFIQKSILLDARRDTILFKTERKPALIRFDRDNHILKELKFYKTQQDWIYQLKHDKHVAARLTAIEQLREATFDTLETVLAMERCLRSDPFWAVRREAAFMFVNFRRPESKEVLANACHDPDSRVRSAAVMGLGTFYDKKYNSLLRAIADSASSYKVISNALYALTHVFDDQSFEFFARFVDMDSHNDVVRSAAFHALQRLKDERAVPIAIRFASDSSLKTYRRSSALTMLKECGIGNLQAQSLLIELLKEDDIHIKKKAITILGSFKTEKSLTALRALQNTPLPDDVQRRLRNSIQKIERALKIN